MAWTEEQLRNARVIYQVGLEVGASLRDIQIALSAAIVESGLRNLNYGDRDSIGMFQQRDAWGSTADRLDPYKSARMFFLGGHAGQRGLLDFANRDQMGIGEAAQAVQVSAFPDRYQEHADEAGKILQGIDPKTPGTLGDVPSPPDVSTTSHDITVPTLTDVVTPSTTTEVNSLGEVTADSAGIGELNFDNPSSSPLDAVKFGQPTVDPMASLKMPTPEEVGLTPPGGDVAAGWRAAIVAAARKMLGTPYVWGGTTYKGVDCSGLIKLLYGKQGFNVPRLSADQARLGKRVDLSKLRPGDLVGWDNSSRNVGADHIAIYIGNGQIIEAPRPGGVVQISDLYDTGEAWGVQLNF
jgi:cell wall-associated NlpC family hydrolase